MSTCFDATALTAKTMLAIDYILQVYLDSRHNETGNAVAEGAAALGFLTNMNLSISTVPATFIGAIGAKLGIPVATVTTVTSPVGLIVGVLGLATLAASKIVDASKKAIASRHLKCKISLIVLPKVDSYAENWYSSSPGLPMLQRDQRGKYFSAILPLPPNKSEYSRKVSRGHWK
jgi:hypothetical protein